MRLSLIIVFFIVVGSLYTLNNLVQTNQENIKIVEESRQEYNNRDIEILGYLENANHEFESILINQITNIVNAYNGEVNVSSIDTDELQNSLEDAINILILREESNYNIEGLELFLAISLEIPEFASIIDGSPSGALSIMEESVTEIIDKIEIMSNESLLLRSDFNEVREDLQTNTHHVHEAHENYFNLTSQLIDSMESNANSSYAQSFLSEFGRLQNNISQILHRWSDLVETYLISPLELDPQEHITAINSIESKIQQSYTNLFAQSLEPQDENLLTSHQSVVIDDFITNLNLNLELMENVTQIILDFETLYKDTFTALSEDIESTVSSVTNIINEESTTFQNMINGFVEDLRSQQASATQSAFIIVASVVAGVFLIFFIIFTRGIGRILKKNERLAKGDLTIPLRQSYPLSEIGEIEESLDNLIVNLRETLTSTNQAAEALSGIAEELAAGSEEASTSIKDVSATIREFSAGSSEQNILLNRVRDSLQSHFDVVEQTANQINETAKFVLRVAKRTNILGLNASIEAAKAGRFGLGFNVVAEEVRDLADDSRESAEQIADSIEDIEHDIQKTVQDILTEVNIVREVAENTAAGSEEASAATSEQVTMMNEISETSAQLSEMSNNLTELMKRFKV